MEMTSKERRNKGSILLNLFRYTQHLISLSPNCITHLFLMIVALGIISHLFYKCPTKVEAVSTTQIKDADNCISKLNFPPITMDEFVIIEPLTICFQSLTKFRMDQA